MGTILKLLKCLLFVKAAKVLAVSVAFLPITGCAIGTGIIFGSLLRAIAYSPEQEEVMFNYAVLGFAFIETFAFMLFGAAGVALFF
jgi:F0F1-type ATP synthase membrane subunit c/vacuolar-type H+-ATPase subunit K